MTIIKHIYLRLLQALLLYLLTSCSNVDTKKINYSFQAVTKDTLHIKEYDKVKFENFDNLNLGFFRGDLWIKLNIQNDDSEPKSYVFINNDRFNRNYTFYKLDTINNALKLVNHILNKSKKDCRTFNTPTPNLRIDLKPNENATYLITSASDGRTKDATPRIMSLEHYFHFINESTILNIVIYGIMFCLLIINIYQWTIYKQHIYFYYILYILTTLLVYLGIEGYLYNLNIKQIIIDHFLFVLTKLWALSLVIYTSKFLNIKQIAPKYYKFIEVVLIVILGGLIVYQFSFYNSSIQHLHYLENVLSSLWLLLVVGMVILSARAKRKELKYYLIPLICFIALTIIGLINVHFQILPGNSFTYVKIGALVELTGFTYFMTIIIKNRLKKTASLEKELLENRINLKEKEKVLASTTRLTSAFKLIENSFSNEADWNDFKEKLKLLNTNFTEMLLSNHPDLSKSELRLLTLIRVGYSQKEIAGILNIAPDSVKKARSRVRKKLNLDESKTLNNYLQEF